MHQPGTRARARLMGMEERIADLAATTFAEALRALPATARPAATLPTCAPCALATLCGGGCRSENLGAQGSADVPVCGPWRVRVVSELLAEDRPDALEWPAAHLLPEAHARGVEAPASLQPLIPSRHLLDVRRWVTLRWQRGVRAALAPAGHLRVPAAQRWHR